MRRPGPATLRLLSGPALGALAALLCAEAGLPAPAVVTAAVTALCATWWVLEPIHIAATSILPLAIFPLAGVLDEKAVAGSYGHPLVMLLMGGFMLSTAMSASGAHRRLALGMVRLVGNGRKRLVLGFMLATALCSMWISNTATVLMMLPVALAVLDAARSRGDPHADALARRLLLGIAWAASIGGMGTPVGTPPNIILMGVYAEATGAQPGFLDWMRLGVPVVVALLPVAWLGLVHDLPAGEAPAPPPVGPMRSHEARVLAVFLLTALAWVTRTAPLGGWAGALGAEGVEDATVAFVALGLLFTLPAGEAPRAAAGQSLGDRLLSWDEARQVPWGLLLLFGGGIAIARAFDSSGLGAVVGEALVGVTRLPPLAMSLVICLVVTFLTEVTSNTAITTLLMPILAAAALGAGIEPALLMVPAAISASCAFMMPVATAPNAIVFGTDRVPIGFMARRGLALNLVGSVIVALLCTWMLRQGLLGAGPA
ncbi:SLC13 family permease [Myxococcota bacterium]|nr:SLC13 family permease [Myxococcota bacterium]